MTSKIKKDVYQIITDRILEAMGQGQIPWQRPWNGKELAPRNLKTKKAYRGANPFLLMATGYASPYWLTYKQAKELGGQVKQGEKGFPVVFWKFLDAKDDKGQPELDNKGQPKKVPLLRYYTVFNVEQCEGLPEEKIPVHNAKVSEHEAIETAESIVENMPKRPEIQHGRTGAYYRPSTDSVGMPDKDSFFNTPEYYSTLFHELGHATGHESRVGRKGVTGTDGQWSSFGSVPYAKEELVAEMTASFLCGQAGILNATVNNSVAYLQSWKAKLKEDPKLFVHAAANAQKAADFILGATFGEAAES